ncbi:hypothetical protein KIMH_01650 [Bombiscardovia apis]|uniref:GTPase n=1 Tax=Bombiscardovia apis TaxID=2932182 RepID=A0ABM8BAW4_9BIFI|nr:hypothetical protein [Bombiscardovia apis]BDR54054.1 hypothetical protein KIMH_01650 [Bombiscardovia apis]
MSTQEKQDASSAKRTPTPRAKIMRGIVTPIFGLLAVACVVFGVLNSTLWKPSPQVDAEAVVRSQYIVTDPGVLQLVDDSATITASIVTGSGTSREQSQICVAIGSAQDAAGWVSGHTYQRIKGLDDWDKLSTGSEKIAGKDSAKAENQVDFRHSDMWQQVKCSASSVSLETTTNQTGQVAIISVEPASKSGQDQQTKSTPAQPQVKIRMHWLRHKLPNFAMPLYFAGALLALLAALSASVFAMEPSQRRKSKEDRPEERKQIGIFEALGTVISPFSHKGKGGAERHSRHSAESSEPAESKPKVVDVHAKNMVADQQGEADSDNKLAETQAAEPETPENGKGSGSDNSFQAYLKRFLTETGGQAKLSEPEESSQADEKSEARPSRPEVSDDTSQADVDDSTVGVAASELVGEHENYDAEASRESDDVDDRTQIELDEGISDETTQVSNASQPSRTRAQRLQTGRKNKPRAAKKKGERR